MLYHWLIIKDSPENMKEIEKLEKLTNKLWHKVKEQI